MSEMTDTDRTIASYLRSIGSDEVPVGLLQRGLVSAAKTPQRGRLARLLAGSTTWPQHGPTTRFIPEASPARFILVAILAAAIVGASILIGGRLLKPPTRTLPAYQGTLTIVGTVPNGFVTLAFGAAQLVDGRVISEGGRPTTPAGGDALVSWDDTGATHRELGRTLVPRQQAHLLPRADGRVLVVGGDLAPIDASTASATASTAEIFDPATGRSEAVIPLQAPRWAEGVVTLADGRVLVAGGFAFDAAGTSVDAAEVLDPESGSSRLVGMMRNGRVNPSMTLLPNGQVFVVSIVGDEPNWVTTAELFDPATELFTLAPGLAPAARSGVVTAALPDGRVMIARASCVEVDLAPRDAAGRTANYQPTPIDVYDPASGAFSRIGELPHCASTATPLTGGEVLVTGFYGQQDQPVQWAGLYDPATGQTRIIDTPLGHYVRVVPLADGGALLFTSPELGGYEGAVVQRLK